MNYLPKGAADDKSRFLDKIIKLNHIRNGVMHPVKNIEFTEKDFKFVQDFAMMIQQDNWRWQNAEGITFQ
jgi:hypothetical protein